MKRGLFVSLEGGDASGKSTALPILSSLFTEALDASIHTTREPATPLPYSFTDLPVSDWRITSMAFALDRVVHSRELAQRIEAGETVVCDRYLLSNIANTIARALAAGGPGNSEADALAHLARVEMPACVPDVVIVLDAPDAVLDARIAAREREGKASAADVATWRGEMRRVYRESELVWMRFAAAWQRARQKAGDSTRDIIAGRRDWMMTRFFSVDTSGSAQETEQRLREVVGEVVNG